MNASCGAFSLFLKVIPRAEFMGLVPEMGAERAAKGLSSWNRFVANMFCQLGQASSLRWIEGRYHASRMAA